mmetsp:Transcript_104598/g.322574  ORF Transcript_104598/g.322574 Transcript_104598/m.322574 type:complete len:294 (+) Transcript_104598:94-975(+)
MNFIGYDPVGHIDHPTNVPSQVPPTRQVVVDHENERHCEGYVEDCPDGLGVDQLEGLGQDPLQLHEAQEADRAQDARHANRLPYPEEAQNGCTSVELGRIEDDPVDEDDQDVKDEPRLHVVLRDLLRPHLDHAITVEARHERPWDVQRPEAGSDHVHDVGELAGPAPHQLVLVQRDDQQGNGQHVVANHDAAEEVPREAGHRDRPDDEHLVAPVDHRHGLASGVLHEAQFGHVTPGHHALQRVAPAATPGGPELRDGPLRAQGRQGHVLPHGHPHVLTLRLLCLHLRLGNVVS